MRRDFDSVIEVAFAAATDSEGNAHRNEGTRKEGLRGIHGVELEVPYVRLLLTVKRRRFPRPPLGFPPLDPRILLPLYRYTSARCTMAAVYYASYPLATPRPYVRGF